MPNETNFILGCFVVVKSTYMFSVNIFRVFGIYMIFVVKYLVMFDCCNIQAKLPAVLRIYRDTLTADMKTAIKMAVEELLRVLGAQPMDSDFVAGERAVDADGGFILLGSHLIFIRKLQMQMNLVGKRLVLFFFPFLVRK